MTDDAFAAAEPSAVAESDEMYFLTGAPANVKIRDELIDIKVLRETDADGLQRWEPVLKRPYPLGPADLAAVFDAMDIHDVPAATGDTSLADFQAIVDAHPAIRTVPVQKRRVRYTIGGCMAERSEIEAGGRKTLTIAVESTDKPAVLAAVETLGLADFLNWSYPEGLAALLDDEPARYAVIDIGTNSIKFHIGEFGPDGAPRTVLDRADVTRLGEGLARDGLIAPEGAERTLTAIEGMVDEAKRHHVRAIAAVRTEGLRQAKNRDA